MSLSCTIQTVDARAYFYIRHSSQRSATVRPHDNKGTVLRQCLCVCLPPKVK